MTNLEQFSSRLRELTSERGLSAYSVTKSIGIPYSTAQAWYTAKSFPTVDYIILLAKFFDCTSDYLLGLSQF